MSKAMSILSVDQINELSSQVLKLQDKKAYNNVVKLINQYSLIIDSQEFLEPNLRLLNVVLLAIFKKHKKMLIPSEQTLAVWFKKNYDLFKNILLKYMAELTFENSFVLDSLDVYFKLIKLEASLVNTPFFPNKTLKKLIPVLFTNEAVAREFAQNYYQKYVDVQYYFHQEITHEEKFNIETFILINNNDSHYAENCEFFVDQPPSAVENENKFKAMFEKNWLWFLTTDITPLQYKTVLMILHKRIIPHMMEPAKLMDFLTDSYDQGGVVSILALNGLFELMKSHNLEYPNFYIKLYSLFDDKLMHVKYRSRFFRLAELFLSSTHLSAQLVSSFIKRMSRLSLNAPPAAVVTVIPFIYNLIKKHPTCMALVHHPEAVEDYVDPYNPQEVDPLYTHAMDSSIWELETMMNHYHPNVATLAKIFSQPFKKLSYNMEDFLDWSYDSLLQAESSRVLRNDVALEFEDFGESMYGGYLQNVAW